MTFSTKRCTATFYKDPLAFHRVHAPGKKGMVRAGTAFVPYRCMLPCMVPFTAIWFTGLLVLLSITAPTVHAHVPYIENQDYSAENPFVVEDSIENSKAIYAWFDTGTDVDVYAFEVSTPVTVYAKALVIACPSLETLLPWFAVVGPGLPIPDEAVPFELPDGYGAVVVQNKNPGETRDTFFEPFSAKTYFDGPEFNQEVTTPGSWYIYYWDPYKIGGDYVAVLGSKESLSLLDTWRSLMNTPKIWFNLELHTKCR